MTRLDSYLAYHRASVAAGDVDPSYGMLLYICDRFELSVEQRYWMAWLYAQSYCGATAYYHYNEFPDYENVDENRMERWWRERGREQSLFQTDRRWPRSRNQVVDSFRSYRRLIHASGAKTQAEHFARFDEIASLERRYEAVYEWACGIYTFGQFALFLYLEALHTITPLKLCPTDLDLDQAWSCRNGLYYAYGRDDLVDDVQTPIRPEAREDTARMWSELRATLASLPQPPSVWQTETVLCAYRKWHRKKRYVGFYLDRQAVEIAKMASNVRHGVCWDPLWDWRRAAIYEKYRAEATGHVDDRGLSREWKSYVWERTEYDLGIFFEEGTED